MPWILNEQEIQAVLSLRASERYEYFIKKVADEQQLWSLRTLEGWVLAEDSEGRQVVPVWPHKLFAQLCATGMWTDCEAAVIELDVWLQRWIPGMDTDGRSVAVIPTPDDRGVVVDPTRLEAELLEELSQYE